MNITTVDMHTGKFPTKSYEFRIDRESLLGNPFRMHHPSDRNAVCIAYEKYFNKLVSDSDPIINSMLELLITEYKAHNKLILYCWCAPTERCHGETIINYLTKELAK